MTPFDGPTWHPAGIASNQPVEAQAPPPESAWECGDCGWTAHAAQLPAGRTLREAIETHGQKYCARPPF